VAQTLEEAGAYRDALEGIFISAISLSLYLISVSRVQRLRDVVLSMRDNLVLEPVQSLRFVRRAFGRRGTCIQPLSRGQIESGADL